MSCSLRLAGGVDLRAELPARRPPEVGRTIRVRIDPDAVDLLRFHRLAAAALTGTDLAAYEAAEHAWAGRPFPDLSGRRLDAVRAHAEDRRGQHPTRPGG